VDGPDGLLQEENGMIYEVRTYDLKPRTLQEFLKRNEEKLQQGRLNHSRLGGFWYTEAGPLNQVVHIWPYEDLHQRRDIRAQVVAEGIWPPNAGEFIVNMQSEIFLPAPFMKPMSEGTFGPIYEMRLYTYQAGDIPAVIEHWSKHIAAREQFSPLIGALSSEFGKLNTWMHIWAYKSFEERLRVRAEAREKGVWPVPGGRTPIRQENKILLPARFSPLQ
jgi:hypothetical protein